MPDLITVKQAAEEAGVTRDSIYRWMREDKTMPVQLRGPYKRKVFDRQEFRDWFLNKNGVSSRKEEE